MCTAIIWVTCTALKHPGRGTDWLTEASALHCDQSAPLLLRMEMCNVVKGIRLISSSMLLILNSWFIIQCRVGWKSVLALQQKKVDGCPDFSKQAIFSQLSSNWLPVVDRKLEHYVGGAQLCGWDDHIRNFCSYWHHTEPKNKKAMLNRGLGAVWILNVYAVALINGVTNKIQSWNIQKIN